MEDPNSDDWLPPGWTVEVRVRKNGKRDKYYIAPSSGLKLKSRVEVFRHLDHAQNKVSIQKISNNVVVKKVDAEGLPPGWIKKTRITTKEDTIKRDSYYIDPVSGYAFRSLKDVDHYLESGEIGRDAFKPKDSSDLSEGATSNPTSSISMALSSDLDMIANNQEIPKPAYPGEYMSVPVPISEHVSTQCGEGTELISSVLLQAEGSDQKEEKVGLAESSLVPTCADEDGLQKQLQENAQTIHGTEKAQNHQRKRHKKDINLPRRASKRLAGVKLDPIPELKTRSRARRVTVKQSREVETVTNEDKSSNNLPNDAAKQISALEGGSEKCLYDSNKGQESFPPQEKHATVKEYAGIFESGDKVDGKLDYSLDCPLGELLTDPCIAFAIQTLTGVTFETSQLSSELKTSNHHETSAAAAAEGHGTNNIKAPNVSDDKEGCSAFAPPEKFAISHGHPSGPEIDGKGNEYNTGSSSEKTLDISWMDPCIEFAIKTLTGTVPLDIDQNPKNCLQQQQHSDMALSSVNLDNLCHTDYYSSQYFGTQQNPMFKQQSFVDPSLQHTRNVGIGNSAGARLPHCGEDRRNIWQR